MAIGKGPGPKKKDKNAMPPSKVGTRAGQTVAAPGYAMGLIKNEKAMKEPTKTKTSGEGAKAVSVTTRAGIIGPKPTGPGGKAVAAAPVKRKGRSAVGQALYNVKDAIGDVAYEAKKITRNIESPFKNIGGGGGGRTCAAYAGYPKRRR